MIQWKDKFYDIFLKDPSKETFNTFINENYGEQNSIDFKAEWIPKGHLAKIILSMANYCGGIIVFGVKEEPDGSLSAVGLTNFEDKANIGNEVSKYISPNLDYEILNFDYGNDNNYPEALNKKFQILFVHNMPDRLPFVSLNSTTGLEKDVIYVRRGTKCEKANSEEIDKMISTKIDTIFKETSDMSLEQHLKQLRTLYRELPEKISKLVRKGDGGAVGSIIQSMAQIAYNFRNLCGNDEYIEIKNPNYPQETYEAFILRMIEKKKLKVEKVLDLK